MPTPLGDLRYTWPFYAALAAGYLLGSIPFGLIISKLGGLGDLRQIGSGNIGATNVLRAGGKALALLTLLFDGAKGAVAVMVADQWGPDMALMAGAGAFIGHLFPVWLKLRGGKGVATALGVLVALNPDVGALAGLTWLVVAAATRYSSLAALTALLLAPVFAWFSTYDLQKVEFVAFLTILVWLRHAGNIVRLVTGKESRMDFSRKDRA